MNTKILSMFLLTAILLLAVVSAASLDIQNVNAPTSVNHDAGSFTITFELVNTGLSATIDWSTVMTQNSATVSFSDSFIADGSSSAVTETITATVNFASKQNGKLEGVITADPSGPGADASFLFSVDINNAPSLTVSDSTITNSDTQTTLTLTNTGNVDFSTVNINIPDITGATFSHPGSISNLNAGQSETVTVNIVSTNNLDIGANTATVTVTANDGTTSTGTITINRNFCKAGEQGTDLEITEVDIDNNDGDDEEWSPLDEIEIEVEVTNNNNDDKIKDVTIEMALFDSEGKDVTNDLDFTGSDDEEIDLGSIKDDDEDTGTFTFTIPADFEDDNYRLVIKAYSDDLKEENECTSEVDDFDDDLFQTIDGEREEDEENHVIFNNIKISPSPAQCNERVQVTGEIFNIGDDDYEDQVRVTMFNSELGINTEQIVREDFDQGDSELIDFEFDVPQNAEEKIYTLEFRTYYDYDDDDDTYDVVSDDKFTVSFRVEGNCQDSLSSGSSLQITADLDSETPQAVAGEQVVVNAVLRNTGDEETTYAVSVIGNSGWSITDSIEPRIVTLSPGQSKEVSIVLSINSDATGDNEFTIRSSYNGQTTEQKVVLPVSQRGTTSDQLGPVVQHLRNNWFIYLIILVNVILIIAIILVIRSMVTPTRPGL